MKERFLKALRGCCTFGVIAVGAYNAFLLVRHFRDGRKAPLPLADLLLADLAAFAAAALAAFAIWLIFYSLGGGKGPGSNGAV